MKKLLLLKSSILGDASVSSELADELVQELNREKSVRSEVLVRNLDQQSVPHLDGAWLAALMTPEADRTDEQQRKVAFSDQLIREVQEASTLVITAPMYNFSIPSSLKAWNDHVARAGTTFKYTEQGPVGLLTDKKVYLIVTMGGAHEARISDFVTPYLKTFLNFIGLKDVEVITANQLNMGDEFRAAGINHARQQIEEISRTDLDTNQAA
jgi:FMN-dependent NADH-azoreductase